MRKLVQFFRSMFCNHSFELIQEYDYYDGGARPYKSVLVYRCKKCGYVQRVKS